MPRPAVLPRRLLLALLASSFHLSLGNSLRQQQCEAGYYSPTGYAPCTPAPPGYAVSSALQTSPRECLTGHYQPLSGAAFCRKCPLGSVAGLGSANCTVCAPGTIPAGEDASTCAPCPDGQFTATAGSTQCTACPVGTKPALGSSTCLPIAPGPGSIALAVWQDETLNLALDGSGAVHVWGSSYIFNAISFPSPVPLASVSIVTGYRNVPATPSGTKVVGISAGLSCGCLLFSDATSGCFGDVFSQNHFSNFVNTHGYITSGGASTTPLTGIRQIVAANGGGVLILRDSSSMTGVVTYLSNTGAGSALNANHDVIDPLSSASALASSTLYGAVSVSGGNAQLCALMGPSYTLPYSIVCFSMSGDVTTLGALPSLNPNQYPYGPSLISVDGTSYLTGARSLSVGAYHACAVVNGTSVPCWGFNGNGQLTGTISASRRLSSPSSTHHLRSSTESAAVSAAREASASNPSKAVTVSITSVGSGNYVSLIKFLSPIKLVEFVSAGLEHTCALAADVNSGSGVLHCWGTDGTNGPAGLSVYSLSQSVAYTSGSKTGRPVVGATSVVSGSFSTCVTQGANAAVSCWGDDSAYQLGDGGAIYSTSSQHNAGPAGASTTFKQLYPSA